MGAMVAIPEDIIHSGHPTLFPLVTLMAGHPLALTNSRSTLHGSLISDLMAILRVKFEQGLGFSSTQ
jgi:hypothetical protein